MGLAWSQTLLRETLAIHLSEHKGASSKTSSGITLCLWPLCAVLAPGLVQEAGPAGSPRDPNPCRGARQPHAAARGMGHQALPPRHPGAHVEKGSLQLNTSDEHRGMVCCVFYGDFSSPEPRTSSITG